MNRDREVQVWAVELDAPEQIFLRCRSWLSPDEHARAGRFHLDEHRRAFLLGRAVLRALLGCFLKIPAAQVQFCYGPKGKPALLDSNCDLQFNVSNSHQLAVYAFTGGCEIGIDVEKLHAVPEMESIARRFFAASEATELLALPEPDRAQAFFHCWTRKEAYIKAAGDGLSVPLDSFSVTLGPGVGSKMLSLGGNAEAAQDWTLHDFSPARDFIGAIAYRDEPRPVVIHSLRTAADLLESL